MDRGIKYNGYPSKAELRKAPGVPTNQELNEKPLAVIECVECIPCNPCETSCPFGAISIGTPISNRPKLDTQKCRGCGTCIARCPGLVIFVVDMNFSETTALVKIPYEFYPLPKEGVEVDCTDREGNIVTKGRILSVKHMPSYNKTYIVGVEVIKDFAMEVRSIRM